MASRQITEAREERLVAALSADVTGNGRGAAVTSTPFTVPFADRPARAGSESPAVEAELRWLSALREIERVAAIGQPDALPSRSHTLEYLRSDLSCVAEFAMEVEADVLRVDELCVRARLGLLSEAEWWKLSSLSARCVEDVPVNEVKLQTLADSLAKQGGPAAGGAELLESVRRRVADAGNRLQFELPWFDLARLLKVPLPTGKRRVVEVHSRMVPGQALGVHFANGYAPVGGNNRSLCEKFTHVPNLAHTSLIDSNGQRLFSGLRHRAARMGELDGALLQRLPDGALLTLLSELTITPQIARESGIAGLRMLHYEGAGVRMSAARAREVANRMRDSACVIMAREIAVAALVADPEKFRQALAGQVVELDLFYIALLDASDSPDRRQQLDNFKRLQWAWPCELDVRGNEGEARKVLVNFGVRSFALNVGSRELGSQAVDRAAAMAEGKKLLGPGALRGLGGDIKERLDRMDCRVASMSQDADVLLRDYSRSVQQQGADDANTRELQNRLVKQEAATALLQRRTRALEGAGKQLKAAWSGSGGWPAGADASRPVAARLALVGHLMGGTPVFSYSNGGYFVRHLDSEVKFLATVADSQDGWVPPQDLDMTVWGEARSRFVNQ